MGAGRACRRATFLLFGRQESGVGDKERMRRRGSKATERAPGAVAGWRRRSGERSGTAPRWAREIERVQESAGSLAGSAQIDQGGRGESVREPSWQGHRREMILEAWGWGLLGRPGPASSRQDMRPASGTGDVGRVQPTRAGVSAAIEPVYPSLREPEQC